jgi:hypothetical protein
MWRTCYCLIVAIFAYPPLSNADYIFQHVGSNDPTTEGWSEYVFSNGPVAGPVINDQNTGIDAWSITGGKSNYLMYYILPNTQELNEAAIYGWTFTVNMSFPVIRSGESLFFDINLPNTSRPVTSTVGYTFTSNTDLSGHLYLYALQDSTVSIQIQNPTAYHLFQLRFDPNSKSAGLFFDGNSEATNLVGASGNPTIDWGMNGTGSTTERVNFNLVQFSVVPEPSTLALLAVGAVGLLARRRLILH